MISSLKEEKIADHVKFMILLEDFELVEFLVAIYKDLNCDAIVFDKVYQMLWKAKKKILDQRLKS